MTRPRVGPRTPAEASPRRRAGGEWRKKVLMRRWVQSRLTRTGTQDVRGDASRPKAFGGNVIRRARMGFMGAMGSMGRMKRERWWRAEGGQWGPETICSGLRLRRRWGGRAIL